MRTFDFAPLLRSSIGFDRFDRMFDMASRLDDATAGYPPYNIEKSGENDYRITMAVAGFAEDELDVTVQQNTLLISGKKDDKSEKNQREYLHRGLAARAFERRFQLADTIQVKGAVMENGLLHVDLVRVIPEAMKPRQIKIAGQGKASAIESKQAA